MKRERGEKENRGVEEERSEGVKNTPNPSTSSLFSGDFAFSVADLRGTNKLKSYWKKSCSIFVFSLNSINLYHC